MLNYLWAGMILIGIIFAAFTGRMPDITNAAIDSSKEAITLCITMMGVMSFWVGLMEIATKAGIIKGASKKNPSDHTLLIPKTPHRAPSRGTHHHQYYSQCPGPGLGRNASRTACHGRTR